MRPVVAMAQLVGVIGFVRSAAGAVPAREVPPRGVRAPFRLLLPAAVVLPLAIQAAGGWLAWSASFEQATAEVTHTADAAAEYVRSVLDGHLLRLERAGQLLAGLPDEEIRAREPEFHAALRAILAGTTAADPFRIYVFGRDAQVLVNTDFAQSPPGDYSDRDYIRILRAPGAPRLVLGETLLGRANERLFFPMTIAREAPSGDTAGGFAGAINISISPEAVAAGLARLRGEPDDVLSLVRENGAVLARTEPIATPPPWRQSAGAEVTRRMAEGDVRFTRLGASPLDGTTRLAAYRQVEGWPVYVAAARTRAAIVARWRERTAWLLAIGLPATLALALLSWLVRRAWRSAEAAREGLEDRVRERTSELARRTAELAGSEERLRLALEAADLGTWEVDCRSGALVRSPRTATILGHAPEELATTVEQWRERIHPADRAETTARFAALCRDEIARYEVQYRRRRPDGSWVWVEACARVVERDAQGRPLRVAGTLQDVTARRAAEERRTLLAREVDHRAKNALAVVQAALRLTPRTDPQNYATAVEGRVAALARAHTLLAERSWSGAELRSLLEGELSAFLVTAPDGGAPQAELQGPPVPVAATAAQSLSLAIHELATNALKYGALSAPGGRLHVAWQVDAAAGLLQVAWVERGGPELAGPPARRGFGSRVIVATVRDQLGGELDAQWRPEGLDVAMRLPLDRVQAASALEPAG